MATWRDAAAAEPLSLVVGAVYRFRGVGEGVGKPLPSTMPETGGRTDLWVVPPGRYRLIGLSTPVRFLDGDGGGGRREVVYEGLDGREKGLLYHTPVEDWWRCFEPPPLVGADRPPDPPPPGKVIDWTERTGRNLREAFAEDARRRAAGEPTDGQLYSSAVRRDSAPVVPAGGGG